MEHMNLHEVDAYVKNGKEVWFKTFSAIPFIIFDYGKKRLFFRGYRGKTHGRTIIEIFEHAQKGNVKGIMSMGDISEDDAKKVIEDVSKYRTTQDFMSKFHPMLSGRYYEEDKVLGFWVLRKQKVDQAIIDFALDKLRIPDQNRDSIRILLDDDWRYQTDFEDMPTYAEFKGKDQEVHGKLTAKEKEQLHIKSPLKLTAKEKEFKRQRAKGFGSEKKIGGTTATRYHQKRRTSESLTLMDVKNHLFEANIGIEVKPEELRKVVKELSRQMVKQTELAQKENPPKFTNLGSTDSNGMLHYAKTKMSVKLRDASEDVIVYVVPGMSRGSGYDPIGGGSFGKLRKGYSHIVQIDFYYNTHAHEFKKEHFEKRVASILSHEIGHVKDMMHGSKYFVGREEKYRGTAEERFGQYVSSRKELVATIPGLIQDIRPGIKKIKDRQIKDETLDKTIMSLLQNFSKRWNMIDPHLKNKGKKFILKKVSEFVRRELSK